MNVAGYVRSVTVIGANQEDELSSSLLLPSSHVTPPGPATLPDATQDAPGRERRTWAEVPWRTIIGSLGIVGAAAMLAVVVYIVSRVVIWVLVAAFFAVVLARPVGWLQGRYPLRSPLVIAGDLHTTIHRASYRDLEKVGLNSAHDDLGLGLRPSFKLAAAGILARLGPLVRLDHALTNRSVWATEVHDLDGAGSDHRPFVVTLAARPPRGTRPPTVFSDRERPATAATCPRRTRTYPRSLPPSDAFETSGAGTTSDKSMRSAMALKTRSKPDPDGIG